MKDGIVMTPEQKAKFKIVREKSLEKKALELELKKLQIKILQIEIEIEEM
ncbi:hypothetical protein KAR91_52170 [Candidatus Pacearchaeota archaeon]|nr:hypothetical protein [Candidatus Pacearchaeota archaeon]